MSMSAIMNTYGDRATTLVKGEGVYLWDNQGRRYLDALSGIAVCGLGYNHPAVTKAISEQAEKLIHCSNLYLNEPQQELGRLLIELSSMNKVFFANSGAEANEAAIKIARKFGQEKGITNPQIITADRSFHGRTMATLSATGNKKVQAGFEPLVSGFIHVAFNSIDDIVAAATPDTVAIMVEPVQGEGGVNVPSDTYLNELRELCDENEWLLILDEIQTGNGRTGKFFAYQHNNILPDVVTTAKGLGNGVPIGACLASGHAAEILQPGNHGSTFGGNPLVCSAALATTRTLIEEDLIKHAASVGSFLLEGLKTRLENNDKVAHVRGKGLMVGIELFDDCAELVAAAKDKNLLLNVTAGNTIRLLPPLILNEEQAQNIVNTVVELIEEF